ncbi:DNA topology modulation protein FlaR [Candidatus Enterococcus willemsii]|uniref:DNA topology modulation protein FlaR n=1 Tax=Candidatus Enterococcus willemsii TaxID=1857215 RepID=A0ABQ6YY06_9ENTE|nr:DNA topology modulation protein FlaR [Enterococcus sp. CU12B]KAF1302246.1 DNA topology modulation protein FlaR [Enterococcus sp. CU12B]
MKIAILGYSGSGKSTLANYISRQRAIPCLHLDTAQFEANWETRPDEEAKAIVHQQLKKEQWVIDGNYTRFYQAERLAQADQIILLLFSRWASLKRIVGRYLKYRGQTRPDMAAGCEEKLDREFIWWVLYEGRTKSHQQHYQDIAKKYPDKTVIIRNQRELDALYQTYK